MTFRTILGMAKKPPFCLVCWPEEDNQLTIVSSKKIVSPAEEDLRPDSFCKVKRFEKHLCRIVAIGTERDMSEKLEEMERLKEGENEEPDVESRPPPTKKRRQTENKTHKGKENKTHKRQQQNKTPIRTTNKKPGTILVVGSEPLKEVTFNIQATPALNSPPHYHSPPVESQKDLSFSSFSSVSISPPTITTKGGGHESLKSDNGEHN